MRDIVLVEGNNEFNIVLEPTLPTEKANLRGYVLAYGEPAPEGAVYAYDQRTDPWTRYGPALADANGYYELRNLPAGVNLYCIGASLTEQYYSDFKYKTLQAGDNQQDFNLTLI